MRSLRLAVLLAVGAGCHSGRQAAPPPETRALGGCPVFPADNEWNRDVSRDPVDPSSAAYLGAMNAASATLHPDFGSDASYGIPWVVVPGTQPRVPITFEYASESDPGPYPFPPDAPIEGGADASGDRHVLVVDRDACRLYEGFDCELRSVAAGWHCTSGAAFDLRSNARRPEGWTSADAAGLPIFPGLVRRDEVVAGEIRHALRFTMKRTQKAHVAPATHHASSLTDPALPPMGLRVRLRADYDLRPFPRAAQVILRALQRYGMFLADNGSDWFVSGESNTAWNDTELALLKTVPASAFDVIKLPPIIK